MAIHVFFVPVETSTPPQLGLYGGVLYSVPFIIRVKTCFVKVIRNAGMITTSSS